MSRIERMVDLLRTEMTEPGMGGALEVAREEQMPTLWNLTVAMMQGRKIWDSGTLRRQLVKHAVLYLSIALDIEDEP